MIKTIIRFLKRKARRMFSTKNPKVRAYLLSYIIALAPANYVTTALTTASDLSNPSQVMQVMKNKDALTSISGLLNTATGGILKPAANGLLAGAGSLVEFTGKSFGLESFIDTGKEWVDKANEWFTAGKNAIEETSKKFADNTKSQDTSKEDEQRIKKSDNSMTSARSGITPGGRKVDYAWNESAAPNYYQVIDKAVTSDREVNKSGEFKYADLDYLGRSGIAEAVITAEDVQKSAGTREEFEKGSDPSGWGHNEKVSVQMTNGKTYNGYAWNRSHLIADSLGGRAYRNNLITGTRMQNVGANDMKGGMQYIERKVVDFLKSSPRSKVWYRVTPIYEGEELVPRIVVVDVLSDFRDIDERVVVYNVLPGYTINYQTGEISK